MLRIHRRWKKVAAMCTVLGAGILPTTCPLEVRDAAISGLAQFVGDSVSALLSALVPVEVIVGLILV